MKISAKAAPFYLVDTESSNVYSCQRELTTNVVHMVSLWGNDRLELHSDGLRRGIKTGIFKRVGVDY